MPGLNTGPATVRRLAAEPDASGERSMRGDKPVSRANGKSTPGGRVASKQRSKGDSLAVSVSPSVWLLASRPKDEQADDLSP
jgi:hypothetical protein